MRAITTNQQAVYNKVIYAF